jgi:hypothetical protein
LVVDPFGGAAAVAITVPAAGRSSTEETAAPFSADDPLVLIIS